MTKSSGYKDANAHLFDSFVLYILSVGTSRMLRTLVIPTEAINILSRTVIFPTIRLIKDIPSVLPTLST
jgi:hypothetical protein